MSWPMVRLGSVVRLINGRAYKKNELLPEGKYRVLRVGNFFSNRGWYWSDLNLPEDKYCDDGDLLYAWSASFGPQIWDGGKVIYHYHIWKLELDEEKVDKKYLFHALEYDVEKIKLEQGTGSTMIHVTKSAMEERQIPLPPLDEQKRIAAILDKADAIRQKRKQAIALADEFLRSVFLEMFGDPVTNPKGWEVKEVSTVCTEIVDCVNRTAPTVDYETPYKMIRTTNVRDKKINLSETRYVEFETYKTWVRRLKPQKGDLIFTREAPAGEAGVIETDDFIFLGQRTMHFRPNQTLIHPVFLLHELTASGVKRQIVKLSAGSTVTHLSVPECKKFLIRVPNIEKQLSFVKLARELEKQINRSSEFFRESEVFFNALSQKAFSGQL